MENIGQCQRPRRRVDATHFYAYVRNFLIPTRTWRLLKKGGKHFLAVGKSQGILIEGEALGTVDLLTKLARFA